MASTSRYIWVDNGLKDFSEGTIPFINAGLHYGISVFEGIRCYATPRGPAIFRLEEHVDRLLDSAHIIGFRDLPFTRDQIIDAIHQTVGANGFPACYIRPLIYLDGGMNLVIDSGRPRLVIAVWEWTTFFTSDSKERGVRANVSSLTRLHPNVSMTKAKISGNYVGSVMAKTESVRLGFDEAIMLDPSGYVAECTGENLFIVRNGVLYTTPKSSILEGITRDAGA
jgi:branched-chain amino acid aminotransferase